MNKMQTYPDHSEVSTSINTKGLFSFSIWKIIAIATIILFLYSSLRHFLFQSTAYDLGIYDQIIYLMSQGSQPISSFLGFHFLGDHAALAIYPLVFLYKLYPTVYWLFLVQAICLASAAGITWKLARLSGLDQRLALAVAIAYLLYPEIFNINLFDFHPDVLAVPAIFGAVLAAKQKKFIWFILAILWILACKAVFSLTVIAIGFWLIFFEQRRFSGMIAIALGIAWFLLVTQVMIPFYSGQEAAGVSRYPYLGNSVLEVIFNTLFKPQFVLGKLLSIETWVYFLEFSIAVIWWLNPQKFIALIPAIPTLLLNLLSIDPMQRSLIYQYSLPALPFLFLVMIRTLAAEKPGLGNSLWSLWKKFQKNTLPKPPLSSEEMNINSPNSHPPLAQKGIEKPYSNLFTIPHEKLPQWIVLWSSLVFLLWGDHTQVLGYFTRIDNWSATRNAVTQIQTKGGVLTDNRLAPHFTHRETIKLLNQVSPDFDLKEFDYVILNLRHPWPDTKDLGEKYVTQLKAKSNFKLSYEKDNVLVFKRI
ncbi:DUF2079 domain-containing protein [Planktothrix mougeotii]|uniref:DUF2079 domain-containing protein n=1 Tax=Planktothrix mougeotii LEGE 06226 TaxID=1828728 RepID=A0ABR9U5F3_9CYAN|nr:DUF2079 domain-containing protein [Planktothrix mougeotii]MBE9141678.1 DUF2079 domain-containing protein [Planktothrix mougeotii LEGE 06226]